MLHKYFPAGIGWSDGCDTHGMFDKCRVQDGAKMLLWFLEFGFLNRCKGDIT